MNKQVLSVILLLISANFLFLADSANHAKMGLLFLVITAAIWWPELRAKLKKL